MCFEGWRRLPPIQHVRNRVLIHVVVGALLASSAVTPGRAQVAGEAETAATPPPPAAAPAPVTFSAGMLAFPVDVSMFAAGKPVLPGVYRVEVYLNDLWKGKFDLNFVQVAPGDLVAQACFDQSLLQVLDIDPQFILPEAGARLEAGMPVCGDAGQVVQGASHRFDSGDQRLYVSTPQITLRRRARGQVDPARWEAGIPAAMLDYRYNGWMNRQANGSQTSHYLGLRGGVNLGDWRARYRAVFNHHSRTGAHYRGDTFYMERALSGWRSRLIVGDTMTEGRVMDSVNVRGVVLSSNERMRPDALSGFIPVIQGIAHSNARVTVHQRGMQIFEMTVAPGPFIIDDLYPGGSGDLVVTVTEADGSQHRFSVAYTNVPELLRPGVTRYSMAVGEYRSRHARRPPKLATATLSRGISNTLTAYGGMMAAQGYAALTLGAGLNLPVGAFTLDATRARTQFPGNGQAALLPLRFQGTGLRAAYTRLFAQTGTDFNLTLARYATQGFFEPGQAFELLGQTREEAASALSQAPRRQLSVNLSQPLAGERGALALSASLQDDWQGRARDVQYHVSYGRGFKRMSASVSATRSRNVASGRWEHQVMLTLSAPLGVGGRRAHLHSSMARRPQGHSAQTNLSGVLGDPSSPMSYNLYGTLERRRYTPAAHNIGASLSGFTPSARLGASASAGSRGNRQMGVSVSGGIVAFAGGVVLSSELGETLGVVQAKGAQGVRIRAAAGTRLNRRGHAIVGHLQPYRDNTVDLDTRGLSTDVELLQASRNVVPTEGAVVLLPFATRIGYSLLITGRREDGSFVPFAAGVFDAEGHNVGYVGQVGQVLVRVYRPQGELTVRWGQQQGQQCRVAYDVEQLDAPGEEDVGAFRRVEVTCL